MSELFNTNPISGNPVLEEIEQKLLKQAGTLKGSLGRVFEAARNRKITVSELPNDKHSFLIFLSGAKGFVIVANRDGEGVIPQDSLRISKPAWEKITTMAREGEITNLCAIRDPFWMDLSDASTTIEDILKKNGISTEKYKILLPHDFIKALEDEHPTLVAEVRNLLGVY